MKTSSKPVPANSQDYSCPYETAPGREPAAQARHCQFEEQAALVIAMVAEAASDRHLQIRLRGMVKVFDTEWAAAMPKRLRPSSPISLPRFNLGRRRNKLVALRHMRGRSR